MARSFLTGCDDDGRGSSHAPELPDDLERVAIWVEVLTGLRLEAEQGSIQVLDNAAWLASRERLERSRRPADESRGKSPTNPVPPRTYEQGSQVQSEGRLEREYAGDGSPPSLLLSPSSPPLPPSPSPSPLLPPPPPVSPLPPPLFFPPPPLLNSGILGYLFPLVLD